MKVSELDIVQRALVDAKANGLSQMDVLAMLPPGHTDQHIMVMLYDHRFLRKLWGDHTFSCTKVACREGVTGFEGERWKFYAIEMLLSGDPVAYIAREKYGIGVENE